MLKGHIALTKFEHKIMEFTMVGGAKEECIVIPIKKNNLNKTEKGNVNVYWVAFETPQEKRKVVKVKFKEKEYDQYESTHIMNQSVSEEKKAELKAKGEYTLTLGNISDTDKQLPMSGGSDTPNQSESFAPVGPGEDLPF